jgi:hypothetical protein
MLKKMSVEEVEPDKWDLEMIERAKRGNDGSVVTLDELLLKDKLTYNKL